MTGTNAMEILPVLIVPAAIMLPPVLITALVLRYRRVRAEMRYRFLLQLAEAGVALPASLPGEAAPQDCDRRRALVLLAGGLGLAITLVALPVEFPRGQPVSQRGRSHRLLRRGPVPGDQLLVGDGVVDRRLRERMIEPGAVTGGDRHAPGGLASRTQRLAAQPGHGGHVDRRRAHAQHRRGTHQA